MENRIVKKGEKIIEKEEKEKESLKK